MLDLGGLRDEDISGSQFERLLLNITNMQMSGTFAGLGRTDLGFNVPSAGASLELDAEHLKVSFREAERDISYDLVHRTLRAADGSQAYGVKVVPNRHPVSPLFFGLLIRHAKKSAPRQLLGSKIRCSAQRTR